MDENHGAESALGPLGIYLLRGLVSSKIPVASEDACHDRSVVLSTSPLYLSQLLLLMGYYLLVT